MDESSRRLVPDELWALVEPLVPLAKTRPQGGGMSRVDDRVVFTAIVFLLTSGCAWRHLPPSFGVTVPTAHRRFTQWTQAGGVAAAVAASGGFLNRTRWPLVPLFGSAGYRPRMRSR